MRLIVQVDVSVDDEDALRQKVLERLEDSIRRFDPPDEYVAQELSEIREGDIGQLLTSTFPMDEFRRVVEALPGLRVHSSTVRAVDAWPAQEDA